MKTDENGASFLKSRAFKEGVVVIIAVALLGVVILAAAARTQTKRARISCATNLRQLGLGLIMWPNDSDNSFPMLRSTNFGGTLEWATSKDVYRHFITLSEEIVNPRVLVCPADTQRVPSTNFASLRNENLSYWLELKAEVRHPLNLLAGDRHLNTNGVLLPNGCNLIAAQQELGWGPGLHGKEGNVGLTDGSVHQVNVANLARLRASQQTATNWLAIP